MFARSTTIQGKPGTIDAGIRFVETEAGPTLDATEGCRGVSMLVDRETGKCIVTSSWSDEAALHASDARLRPLRDRGRDILGGPMQVDEWEIAVMHRTHHGEACRVSWVQGDVATMIETFRIAILPQLAQLSGFCSASLLVDTAGELCCATTAWDTRASMAASRTTADEMRTRVAAESEGTVIEVDEFDLVYAHLHVPEMA